MIAGVDLGGTQVRVAVARPDGAVVATARTRTAFLGAPELVVAWAAGQIQRLGGGGQVRSVAIGAPGPIDSRRGVLVNPPNLVGWKNVPLAAMLSAAVGCPVHLGNDADMAALGEFHQGAGRAVRTMAYVTWSTGVGGGLIVDGDLFSGAHGSAGEIGHMVLDPQGPLDACGQRGCVEVYCGGRALSRQTGESAAELFQAAARGDHEAAAVVIRAATYMGWALVNLANLFDPEMIVLGGGVGAGAWAQVEPVLRATIRSSPFIKAARRPRLRRAQLGDRAGQAGAVEWARSNL